MIVSKNANKLELNYGVVYDDLNRFNFVILQQYLNV